MAWTLKEHERPEQGTELEESSANVDEAADTLETKDVDNSIVASNATKMTN